MALYAVVLTVCLKPTMHDDGSYAPDACDSYVINQDDSFTTRRRCINHGLRVESSKLSNIIQAKGSLQDYLSMYEVTTPVQDVGQLFATCEAISEDV